jgi:hypothetical protein
VVNQGGRKKVVETGEGKDVYALDVSAMAKKGKTILRDFQSGIDKVALDVDGKTKVRGYGSNKLTITSGKKTHTIKSTWTSSEANRSTTQPPAPPKRLAAGGFSARPGPSAAQS